MTVELALYQPDIPQNTGTLLRLSACLGIRLHIIHPTGFPFSPRTVRAAALDYFDMADFVEHASYPDFDSWRRGESRRLCLLTTRGSVPHTAATFLPGDILMLGRESAGVPEAVAEGADLRLRIPMHRGTRSLNVAIAGSLVLGEALRQTGHFATLT